MCRPLFSTSFWMAESKKNADGWKHPGRKQILNNFWWMWMGSKDEQDKLENLEGWWENGGNWWGRGRIWRWREIVGWGLRRKWYKF